MRLLGLHILLFLLTLSCFGQGRKKLERQKEKLYDEIGVVKDLLKSTQNTKEASLTDVVLLAKEIENREEIITTIQQQLNLINTSIAETGHQIDSLKSVLEQLKKEYAKLVRHTYLYQNAQNTLLFLFSAHDFNDAYRRYTYIQYYRTYRKKQLENIKSSQDTLFARLGYLKENKNEKVTLLWSEQDEMKKLEVTKQDKAKAVANLKKQESKLKYQLGEKEKALDQLNEQIEMIIAQVLDEKIKAKEREKEKEKESGPKVVNKPKKKKGNSALISAKFAEKKGKLPWPVDNGVITGKFGKNRHPVLRNITTTNNGIDITTAPGSTVHALFDGVVTNMLFNPSFQWAVIVKHGNYFTVYAKLKEVSVSKGDKITSKQSIGLVYTDDELGKTEAHLEIWEGTKKMNPVKWIHK